MNKQVITTYLQLPFQFIEEKLVEELQLLLASDWIPHFNKSGYAGTWNSIALYAPDGDQKNIFAFNGSETNIKATPILNNCEYLKEVISTFKCPLLSVRLLKLSPGGFIKPHRDFELGYEDGCFRIHIPILTHSKVTFTLDNHKLEMKPGECWYTNVNYVHSVSNEGLTDRIHLVIDGQRNDWSDDLFFSMVPRESLLQKEQQAYDPETLKRMILELENHSSVGAQDLIQELKRQLGE